MLIPIGDDQEHDRPPVVTLGLIGLNVGTFLVLCLPEPAAAVLESGALWPGKVTLDSLFSHLFLHANLLHLAGNMVFLWIFGRLAEERFRRVGFAAAYLLSGFAAAALHVYSARGISAPAIGSSGAVAGAIGACLVFCPRARVRVLYWFWVMAGTWHVPVTLWVLFWMATQVFFASSGYGGGGAYAHLGGFAMGAAAAWGYREVVWRLREARRPPAEVYEHAGVAAEPRRPMLAPVAGAEPVLLDESVDSYAVVTLTDGAGDASRIAALAASGTGEPLDVVAARVEQTRGTVARRLSRASAENLRRVLAEQGLAVALIADQPANHPPVPQVAHGASWDDRTLRLRMSDQVVPLLWTSPFLVVAAGVGDDAFVEIYVSRRAAFRIRRAPAVGLTRVDAKHRSERKSDLRDLARDVESARGGAGTDEGIRRLAQDGEGQLPRFGARAGYEDYLFRVYHLAQAGSAIRGATGPGAGTR